MKESFYTNEQGGVYNPTEQEKDQALEFVRTEEGRLKVARVLEKPLEDVTDHDGEIALSRVGNSLFSKEIKLDEVTPGQKRMEDAVWEKQTEGEYIPDEPGRKAA